MKQYEIMTIYKIDLGEEGAKKVSKQVQEIIEAQKGTITKKDFWGKRKFAYEIKHDTEGFYDVIKFELDPSKVLMLKAKLRLVDSLVRYIITAQG